jgi:hypothetical protein
VQVSLLDPIECQRHTRFIEIARVLRPSGGSASAISAWTTPEALSLVRALIAEEARGPMRSA